MQNRIEFIDLAKGVCILFVVLGHTGVGVHIPGLAIVRMPLYFVLSGLFFKEYGSIKGLVIKKINKLLIPFLFFYIGSYAFFYLFEWLMPGLIKTSANGILDVFTQDMFFNGPIWFLLALFWCNMLCSMVHAVTKDMLVRCVLVLVIGALGCWLGKLHIFVPCKFATALTAMPLFYFGYMLKQSSILYPNKWDNYWPLLVVILWAIAFFFERRFNLPHMGFNSNNICGNPLLIYSLSVIEVLCLLLLCKAIKRLPFVSYFGRYSIIPLCLHHLMYRPIILVVSRLEIQWGGVVGVITILFCFIAIPFFVKYLPYVTAQKDLIKIK